MFAGRSSSKSKTHASLSSSVVGLALLCSTFLIVLDIDHVTAMSLDRLALERNEILDHQPQQQQHPEEPTLVVDDMELEALPAHGDTDMYVLLPVGSDGVDKNIIDYAAEMDAADHGGDMLMMESNDEPAMQMVQMPELLAELQRDSDESDDVEEESAAVNQPEEAAVPASESNETENSEEPVKESIEEAVEKVEEPAQEFTELQEEPVEKVEEPAEESIDTTTPIALMLAEMAQQQAAEAQASEEADLAPMAMQDPVDEETQALENGEVEQTDEAVTEGKLEIPMPEESMNSEMVDEAAAEMTTEKIDEVEAESMAQIIAEAVEEAEEAMEAEAEAVTEAEVQSVISGDQDDENEVPSDTQEETTAAYVEQTDETMAEVSSNELLKEPMNEEVVDEESITEAIVAQSVPEALEDAVIPEAVESLADAAPIETEDQAVAESEIDSTTVAPLEIDAEAETVEETANVVSEQLESEAHNDDDEEEVKVEPEAHMDDVENEVEPESHIVPGDIQVEDEETKAEDEIKVDEQPIALDQVVPEAANEPEEIHGEPEIEDLKQDDEDVAISQEESHVEDAETHEEKQEESPIVDEEKDNQAETQVAEESLPEAEEQKGEEQPAAEQKEEQQPAEEQKEEEQPAQEQHEAEEQPAEEQKEEEQPAEEQKEEEQPAAEQQEEEQPAEEQKVEEQPSEKQPAEEQKEEEQSAEPQQEEEQPAEEQKVEEQPAEEQPAEEHKEEEHQEEEQLTEEQSQAASEQNVEEAKAPQEETPKEEDSVIPPSPDSTISLDEVAESGADVTQEHETEEVQAQAEQEIIAETPEETEQETLESHDLTADDDDSAPVLAEEPAQENLPTEAEKDPQMEAEIPAAEVHEVNEVETVAEEAVNKVEEEEKKPTISMDAAANQNEVAQETQESIKEPQNTDLNSMLTTIVQVPQPQQQSQQQQQQQESELPSTVDEVPTKVENVAVMQPTIQMPMPAPQGASIGSTNQKPLNVMDSVLNYVNASFLNNNNEKNQQKPQDDGDSFSSKLRRYDGAQVWRIVVQNDRDKKLADQLQTKFDGQLWKEVKAEVDYLLKPQVLADAEKHIRAANLSRIVLIDNLQKVIEVENPPAEEIAQLQNRKGHRMTWQAYHRLADIHGFFDYLAKTYPDICSVETIGYSIQKRQLKILKISNGNAGNPGVWIDGGMHAREWISPASVTYIANQIVEGWDDLPSYMRNVNWYIHAVANPDGYEYSHTTDRLWRKNMRSHGRQCPGVDLNRNFGYKWGGKGTSANPCAQTYRGSNAFSEPETFYISKYISNFPRDTFQAYLSFHSYGQYILYPWGYDYQLTKDRADLDRVARQAGTIITRSSGVKYTVGASATTLYPAAGGSDDWAKGFAGIKYAYTIEMGDTGRYGFVLPASMIESNGKDGYTFVQTVARAVTNTDMHSRKRSF